MRRFLLISAAASLAACGSDAPTKPPFGEQLTVAEQIAVEAAFGRIADSIDATDVADDSILADFTRVAARLLRFQGRYGTIAVQVPGSTERVQMRAVAITATTGSESGKTILAWEGLDEAAFTVQRALVLQSGGFQTFLAPQVRYFDLTNGTAAGAYSGGGSLTFSAMAFTNACAGLTNNATQSCKAGKITAAGDGEIRRSSDAVGVMLNWAATPIAGFEVIVVN